MKRFTQCVCMVLVMVSLLVIPAEAAEQRASNFFMKYSVYIDEVSSNEFEVWFDVTAVDVMSKLGVSKIVVERSSNKSYWTPMKTYNMSDYSQMTDTNTAQHDGYVTYDCLTGYYYRAIVTLYAKNSLGYGEYDVTTPVYHS